MLGRRSLVLAAALGVAFGACIDDEGFACETDDECLAAAMGRCELDVGACSYPDGACESGRRYGQWAPGGLGRACVPPGGGDDGPTGPSTTCGDGTLDPGETCDDGNRDAGDGCHPWCVEPGDAVWTVTWDGDEHGDDRAFGLAIDPAADAFYVVGLTTADPAEGSDLLVQRRRLDTGELAWTRRVGGDAGADDTGEHVAIDSAGDLVVVGKVVGAATAGDVWLRKYDPDGNERWTSAIDIAGGDDMGHGVTIAPDGTIVAVGQVTVAGAAEGDVDAWIARLDPDGMPIGDPVIRGVPGDIDRALDVLADEHGVRVTGSLHTDGVHAVWTAAYDAALALRWEDLATLPDPGNEARGVGLGLDGTGGSATAGVLGNDIWVRRHDASGTPTLTLTEAGTGEMHDEAADVAFLADGSFVVVGFLDFATVGFATGNVWIRHHAPDGTPLWTDTYDGPSEEIDKALAVEVTPDRTAVVVGYETVPGQSRDVWMRRYAL